MNVASISWGKDSFAMLLYIIENNIPLDEVVFYDTGMEFQAIYNLRDKFLPVLKQKGVKYTELKPKRPFLYDMLEKPVCSSKGCHNGFGWCGGVTRWATFYKTNIIDKYFKSMDIDNHYIGIAFDETERLQRLQAPKCSPIAEAKMTEADCLQYCRDKGYSWEENGIDLYNILDRVSCWCCSNKNRKELKNIYLYLPEYWEKLKALQTKIDKPMKRYCNKKYGEYGNLFDMEKVFEIETK